MRRRREQRSIVSAAVLLVTLAMLGCDASGSTGDESARPSAAERPNLVLMIGCSVRKDRVTPHGGEPGATPFLQELANTGARFDDLIAAAPWTKPAVTAILTGRHALETGMVEPGPTMNSRVLQASWPTLASLLHDAGYETIGATANPNLNAAFGFARGFDTYVEAGPLWRHRPSIVRGHDLLDRLDEALTRADGRPLYVQVTFVDAHAGPREPAEAQADAPPRPPAQTERGYAARLSALDEAVRALAQRLEAIGLDQSNTVFAFVSDHGEGLRDPKFHGRGHGRHLYPSTIAAVGIIRGPGIGEGVVIEGVTSQVDLMPTLLSLLGVSAPPEPGYDHAALMAAGGTSARTVAFADTWSGGLNKAALYTHDRACQLDFARAPARAPMVEGCFDRVRDPDHREPLRDPDLEGKLRGWRAEQEARYAATPRADAGLAPAAKDELEALGYVGEPR